MIDSPVLPFRSLSSARPACRGIVWILAALACSVAAAQSPDPVRVGMIGLDTSHSTAFTGLINADDAEGLAARYEVVAAYPQGSTTIPSSYERIPEYTEEVRALGVSIVDSIDDLLDRVDVVLLETNDGKPHREQALQVIAAGKPLFIDKPVAAELRDVLAIYDAAAEADVPLFSSSSLRYMDHAQDIRNGSIGRVYGATTYSPASLEPSHTDQYWYGIHGVEALFTVMGTGCETVVRTFTDAVEMTTCRWEDGRVGSFFGIRSGRRGYGGTAFGEEAIAEMGPYGGYEPLVEDILRFFETRESPVSAEETIEIYAFMTAADESRRRGGEPVSIEEVLETARR